MRFALFLVLLLPVVANASQQRISLNDARGGDCGLNYLVYDKIYDKTLEDGGLSSATAFVNDVCDMPNRVLLGINGEVIQLDHKFGKVVNNPRDTLIFFSKGATSLALKFKKLIHVAADKDFECKHKWYRVVATVRHDRATRVVNGSVDWGDCP
jgi:hypothetical protein